ncbi:uncharacterized protein LOC142533685 [Primulina tabacum]|uniref:uncharacterized protein LOC142533685 n=1 Tax=Primulina tabacum TaxID=48773 RepID=UPI003F5A470F
MAAAAATKLIEEETVLKAVKALLKWKNLQLKSQQNSENEEGETDDFMYLSMTLRKVLPENLTLAPHRIRLRHSLFSHDGSSLSNTCLIIDGKRITSEGAHKILESQGIPISQVIKLSKLKSDYKSFDSKKKLYDSFDVFFAVKGVIPLLPKVLGRVFYNKKKKIPVPVDLRVNGDWKEEMEKAFASSLLCLSGGTCSAVRVGRWGVMERDDIVENVFQAVDGLIEIVPKKWGGIKCFHLKFSDSVALPIYEYQPALVTDDDKVGLVVGNKSKRGGLLQESGRKEKG